MNIYDKFPMKFVKWATENGMTLSLHKDYIDIETGMKSHLHLHYEDGVYVAKMRYGESKVIDNFFDLYLSVRNCEHGRDFMGSNIANLYENGFGELDWEPFG